MASYEVPGFTRSYSAAGDLTASKFRFVKLSGATITAVAAATDKAVGVLQNKVSAAGDAGTVMISGVTRVYSGAAFAAGVPLYLDSVGRVSATAQAGQCIGTSEQAATAADQLVAVLLKPLGSII